MAWTNAARLASAIKRRTLGHSRPQVHTLTQSGKSVRITSYNGPNRGMHPLDVHSRRTIRARGSKNTYKPTARTVHRLATARGLAERASRENRVAPTRPLRWRVKRRR